MYITPSLPSSLAPKYPFHIQAQISLYLPAALLIDFSPRRLFMILLNQFGSQTGQYSSPSFGWYPGNAILHRLHSRAEEENSSVGVRVWGLADEADLPIVVYGDCVVFEGFVWMVVGLVWVVGGALVLDVDRRIEKRFGHSIDWCGWFGEGYVYAKIRRDNVWGRWSSSRKVVNLNCEKVWRSFACIEKVDESDVVQYKRLH